MTCKRVVYSVGYSAKSRDRRPRLSALTRLISPIHFLFMRTDEGVCPYFESPPLIEIDNW
ncbi:hypothetical protein HMPREF0973_02040 [Prevotella veroralis F0319]|uniref:Uncharacterized protein n=1 Tax=Prevotella veroralis F0319 TaxID=649761 RepID=C9MR05_9BACT|nr:hypothetical protein HMPREF0973_02040 [Prevotella veroralis F0319]